MSDKFTHLDEAGNPSMVDVGKKQATYRRAVARAIIQVPTEVMEQLENGDIQTKKGPVFQTAIIAGVMAAKRTGELIPLCHPIGMDNCQVDIHIDEQQRIVVDCTASVFAKTGIEMEAMTGASLSALTIYDMCKAFTHDIIIQEVKLMAKSGGKRDFQRK